MEKIILTLIEHWQEVTVLTVVFGLLIIGIIKSAKDSNMSLSKGKVSFANTQQAIKEIENTYYKRGKAYREYISKLEKEIRNIAYFDKPERLRAIRQSQMKRFSAEVSISYIDNLQNRFESSSSDPMALQRDLGRIALITELLNYKVKEHLAELVMRNHFAKGSEAEFHERIRSVGEVIFSEVEEVLDNNHHFEVVSPEENRNYHREKMPKYLDILSTLMHQSRNDALYLNNKIGVLLKTIDKIEREYDKGAGIDEHSLDYYRDKGRELWMKERAKDPDIIYGVEDLI